MFGTEWDTDDVYKAIQQYKCDELKHYLDIMQRLDILTANVVEIQQKLDALVVVEDEQA